MPDTKTGFSDEYVTPGTSPTPETPEEGKKLSEREAEISVDVARYGIGKPTRKIIRGKITK